MAPASSLVGKRVLVVGGARDLGLAIATGIIQAGGASIVGARSRERGDRAARSIGADFVHIDVTSEDSIASAIKAALPLDHIVITASAHHNVQITELDHDRTMDALQAKVIGPLLLAKHAATVLASDGSIVLFSGIAAWRPTRGYPVMGIANGAVSFAASHLARELAPIRVNAISPGIIDSGSWDSLGDAKGFFLNDAEAATLVGRVGTNADIVDAVLWLLNASFVTGETIHVDGGARFK